MRVFWMLFCVVLFSDVQAQDGLRSADPDYATRMIEATYKIFNKASTATGFFVQPPLVDGKPAAPGQVILVTADHVLNKATGETVLVVLREKQPDGSYKRKDWPVTIRKGETVLWTKHPDLDIAVIALAERNDVMALERIHDGPDRFGRNSRRGGGYMHPQQIQRRNAQEHESLHRVIQ